MKLETILEIQASADGETSAVKDRVLRQYLAKDPEAKRLHTEISRLRAILGEHESAIKVSDSREFYWFQIQRRIQVDEQVAKTAQAMSAGMHIWRWLAPMMAISAVIAVVALQPFTGGNQVKATASPVTTVTFSSEADGVTIHWIN